MKWPTSLLALALASPLASAASSATTGKGDDTPTPDKDGKYWIHGDGLSAAFIPYGASISNLLFEDQYGIVRDLVGGFDNASYYSVDKQHPHFGGVPGRYANRIKNSSFEIDGQTYKVAANENPTPANPDGIDTLHGGPDGWDWRNFTVVSHSDSSITFSFEDPDGKEGFPGEVVSLITYSLTGRDWDFTMVALATTEKTPIMLSSHTYWNLDGFANNETNTALNHSLHMPYGRRRIGVDNILIPTGEILSNDRGSVNDFWSEPRQIGAALQDPALLGNCGFNCTGYDNCYTIDRGNQGDFDWRGDDGPVATMSSAWSGIQLDIFTDQVAFQVYSCHGQNGSMALKQTQGATDFPRTIPKYGCVVLEVEDYIDGINNPQWGRKQVYGPLDGPYTLQAKYRFSLTSEH
ncbi:Diphthamide biosynthesis protein 1 [Tolypocladium capitatum]|uniref:Diphthamide biosynthesis protein 1 n=1 Tax=Tolypocladium capitatum TaxID=45235 RepID=A0A2K3QP06_9HYPO|nr:Diphthamide biosynthesis protein 1 [Tolypocladium capitatum]